MKIQVVLSLLLVACGNSSNTLLSTDGGNVQCEQDCPSSSDGSHEAMSVMDSGFVNDSAQSDADASMQFDVLMQPDVSMADVSMQPDASLTCNMLSPIGPLVVQQYVNQPAPPATGGAIIDGLYILQSQVWYGSGCLPDPYQTKYRTVYEFSGSTLQAIFEQDYEDGGVELSPPETATITTSGNTLIVQFTCPGPRAAIGEEYTALSTQLLTFAPATSCVRVNTFAKQ